MHNILFLTQRIPWPPIKGEKIRPGHIMRRLAQRHRIFLGTMIDDPADASYIDVVRQQVHEAYFGEISRTRSYATAIPKFIFKRVPLSFGVFAHYGLSGWVTHIMETQKPTVVFVCSTNMMQYIENARHRPDRLVVDFADVDSEKWRSYAANSNMPLSLLYRREASLVRKQEERIARTADWVTFVTNDEATLFNQAVPGYESKVRGLLSGVDTDFFAANNQFREIMRPISPNFVFTGHMDYPPNVEAVRWFAQEILPLIRQPYSDTRFFIVGNRPSNVVQKLASLPGVTVTGRVPDVRSYLAHCTASVAPMRIARGIQNKVLEALSMAAAVVATKDALTGLDAVPGIHVLQADTTEDFARSCITLIENLQLRRTLGEAARKLMESGWSWESRLNAFEQLLDL